VTLDLEVGYLYHTERFTDLLGWFGFRVKLIFTTKEVVKVVKIDSKIIIFFRESKSVTHSVALAIRLSGAARNLDGGGAVEHILAKKSYLNQTFLNKMLKLHST